MTNHKKITSILGIILFIVLTVFGVLLVMRLNKDTGATQPQTSTRPITIEGTFGCLPHKGSGPSTLECAYGIKAQNGTFYGLKNFKDTAIKTNDRLVVTGTLQNASANDKYDTAGYITVSSFTKR